MGKQELLYRSDVEMKVVETAMNPDYFGKSINDKIKIAGVSRDSWYRIMKKPYVIELMNRHALQMLRSNMGEVMKATIDFGIGGKSNYQDRRFLLQMLGLLGSEGTQVNIGVNGDGTQVTTNSSPYADLSKEQLEALADKYMNDPEKVSKDCEKLGV